MRWLARERTKPWPLELRQRRPAFLDVHAKPFLRQVSP
jgi:hypothetical protein